MDAQLIEKEQVINYKFTRADKHDVHVTREKLERALRLGNEYKTKTSIVFQTLDGAKRIDTTVWTLTDDFIQIKGGVAIPITSIIDVN